MTADVAVVGSGAAGALVCLHLARAAPELRTALIGPGPAGVGVAYSTLAPEHLLNVPVARMSARSDEPDEFLPVDGLFTFVGVEPKSDLVKDLADLDKSGYVKVDHNGLTSYPGLYAAGDVTASALKQVITAASGGASAAFEALKYIDERQCSIG